MIKRAETVDSIEFEGLKIFDYTEGAPTSSSLAGPRSSSAVR